MSGGLEAKGAPGSAMALEDGSRVGVVGGGPAGTFFSYFLLDMAARVGTKVELDIFEPKNFNVCGPAGCNHCGGIISESLVQALCTEGINLPTDLVERGIDSYVLHMDAGTARIATPTQERRIAGVYRGGGPKGTRNASIRSFDGYLLDLASEKGARVVRDRVAELGWSGGKAALKTRGGIAGEYDLIAVAVGVNSSNSGMIDGLGLKYRPPKTTKAYICELDLGRDVITEHLGSSMHVFLLDIPRLEFGAIIPKGDSATLCMLGEDIDAHLVKAFLGSEEVKSCLPFGFEPPDGRCHCYPKMSLSGAEEPFGDRVVFLNDCAVTRLYKDGIGAAYRVAKAAAVTAVFDGVSREDFLGHYWPVCRAINSDNAFGRFIFAVTGLVKKTPLARRVLLRTVNWENRTEGASKIVSEVFWDTFTGSAPYRDILSRTFHPTYVAHMARGVFGK